MSVDQTRDFVKRQNPTHDAFLGGRLTISQPANGFRAGSDSVLLGASVPAGARSVLDLGAGVGTAGLVAALWAENAKVLLAERDDEALALANENIRSNALSQRIEAVGVDVTAADRDKAGLLTNRFDVVIANPPYFSAGKGTPAGGAARDAARHSPPDHLDLWVRSAVTACSPKGEAIFILPADRLGEALSAFDRRFGGVRVLPIAARPDADAGRIMVRGIKGSRAGLKLLSPLVLHGRAGNAFADRAADILLGRTKLDW